MWSYTIYVERLSGAALVYIVRVGNIKFKSILFTQGTFWGEKRTINNKKPNQ